MDAVLSRRAASLKFLRIARMSTKGFSNADTDPRLRLIARVQVCGQNLVDEQMSRPLGWRAADLSSRVDPLASQMSEAWKFDRKMTGGHGEAEDLWE